MSEAVRDAWRAVRRFVLDVVRAFTWHRLLLVEAVFLVLDTIANFVMEFPEGSGVLRLVIGHTMAFSIVLSVTIGDQAAARGMRTFAAYALPLALTSYVGAHLQSWVLIALDREPPGWEWLSVIDICFEIATYSAAFTLGYIDYQRRIEITRRVRAAELAHARNQQDVVESRLAAARADVDPQGLLVEIDALQQLFVDDPSRADSVLDELIDRLRDKLASQPRRAVPTPAA